MTLLKTLNYYKDASEINQLSFPDAASPISEQLVFFHDNIMFILLLIVMLHCITNVLRIAKLRPSCDSFRIN